MGSQGVQLQAQAAQSGSPDVQWGSATRVGFRFCFVYFGLYCLLTQILTSLIYLPESVNLSDLGTLPPFRNIVLWTAKHILHISTPVSFTDTGSGDRTFDWVLVFCLLILSASVTAIWSFVGRRQKNYVGLHKWFRLCLRFFLAGQMLSYGLVKAIPLQMPYPYLTKLLEPFGNFSPMGVLWFSIGASPRYEMFAGCAEILGGLLLILPRTTTLGALICLADMVQVFTLNMTYDVPVKLLSFHLLLMSAILLAPDVRRLVNVFLLNRAVGPSTQEPVFSTRRRSRIALIAQVVFGVYLIAINVYQDRTGWSQFGGGSPKAALYGIWDVDQISIDGQIRSPLTTDYGRWRRVVFDIAQRVAFQRIDETFVTYAGAINAEDKTVVLSKRGDPGFKAKFAFQRPQPNQLTLDGEMDGHKLRMHLALVDTNKFLLVTRGFHWVQEAPFNR